MIYILYLHSTAVRNIIIVFQKELLLLLLLLQCQYDRIRKTRYNIM